MTDGRKVTFKAKSTEDAKAILQGNYLNTVSTISERKYNTPTFDNSPVYMKLIRDVNLQLQDGPNEETTDVDDIDGYETPKN